MHNLITLLTEGNNIESKKLVESMLYAKASVRLESKKKQVIAETYCLAESPFLNKATNGNILLKGIAKGIGHIFGGEKPNKPIVRNNPVAKDNSLQSNLVRSHIHNTLGKHGWKYGGEDKNGMIATHPKFQDKIHIQPNNMWSHKSNMFGNPSQANGKSHNDLARHLKLFHDLVGH